MFLDGKNSPNPTTEVRADMDEILTEFCRKCGEKNECHGEHCVFWEYKEKEGKDDRKERDNSGLKVL